MLEPLHEAHDWYEKHGRLQTGGFPEHLMREVPQGLIHLHASGHARDMQNRPEQKELMAAVGLTSLPIPSTLVSPGGHSPRVGVIEDKLVDPAKGSGPTTLAAFNLDSKTEYRTTRALSFLPSNSTKPFQVQAGERVYQVFVLAPVNRRDRVDWMRDSSLHLDDMNRLADSGNVWTVVSTFLTPEVQRRYQLNQMPTEYPKWNRGKLGESSLEDAKTNVTVKDMIDLLEPCGYTVTSDDGASGRSWMLHPPREHPFFAMAGKFLIRLNQYFTGGRVYFQNVAVPERAYTGDSQIRELQAIFRHLYLPLSKLTMSDRVVLTDTAPPPTMGMASGLQQLDREVTFITRFHDIVDRGCDHVLVRYGTVKRVPLHPDRNKPEMTFGFQGEDLVASISDPGFSKSFYTEASWDEVPLLCRIHDRLVEEPQECEKLYVRSPAMGDKIPFDELRSLVSDASDTSDDETFDLTEASVKRFKQGDVVYFVSRIGDSTVVRKGPILRLRSRGSQVEVQDDTSPAWMGAVPLDLTEIGRSPLEAAQNKKRWFERTFPGRGNDFYQGICELVRELSSSPDTRSDDESLDLTESSDWNVGDVAYRVEPKPEADPDNRDYAWKVDAHIVVKVSPGGLTLQGMNPTTAMGMGLFGKTVDEAVQDRIQNLKQWYMRYPTWNKIVRSVEQAGEDFKASQSSPDLTAEDDAMDLTESRHVGTLHAASEFGYEDRALHAIRQGEDINHPDEAGRTPLMHASLGGHWKLVHTLVANGADVSRKDRSGRSALHHAARARSRTPKDVEHALSSGGMEHAEDRAGFTPQELRRRVRGAH